MTNQKNTKSVCVCGAGGFIGHHLVKRLKQEGFWVRGVDLKLPEFEDTLADEFIITDLSEVDSCRQAVQLSADKSVDYVYQLAADMGGAGYIFTGENDANVMHNSALINLHMAQACVDFNVSRIFYSSSACMYPSYNQEDPSNPNCKEDSAYPADPDSEYGWEKLFSERLYLAFHRNHGLDVRIARLHNVFGPLGAWEGGREKAPAAICRKVALAEQNGSIDIWGDGSQTRSFLYIDECVDGIRRLMDSDVLDPINLGSDQMVTINELVDMVMHISNKSLIKNHIDGPLGVRGRNSDNTLIKQKLSWAPSQELVVGLTSTYEWIGQQIQSTR